MKGHSVKARWRTLQKIARDAKTAKEHYSDVKSLIFVTPDTVSKKKQESWVKEIASDFGLELTVIEREDVITSLMMPDGAILCRNFLGLDIPVAPDLAGVVARISSCRGENCGWPRGEGQGPNDFSSCCG